MSKFIAASRQATRLDKTRILLKTRIRELNDESKKWVEVAATAKEKGKELLNLIEELKTDVVEKDTHLDHLQKKNDELSTLLFNAKADAVTEFKSSNEYTKLLDANYATGFEDFRMEAIENFPEVDFSSIKLNLTALCFKPALRTSMLKMMLQPCLPRTTPKWMPPLLRKYFKVYVPFSFVFYLVHYLGLLFFFF